YAPQQGNNDTAAQRTGRGLTRMDADMFLY
ncbi:MAG: hypothetical protein QG637_1501, partial [Chloroflexota bacterium]|nr:hypothetical protein [Chloroflexota bacterium]